MNNPVFIYPLINLLLRVNTYRSKHQGHTKKQCPQSVFAPHVTTPSICGKCIHIYCASNRAVRLQSFLTALVGDADERQFETAAHNNRVVELDSKHTWWVFGGLVDREAVEDHLIETGANQLEIGIDDFNIVI